MGAGWWVRGFAPERGLLLDAREGEGFRSDLNTKPPRTLKPNDAREGEGSG